MYTRSGGVYNRNQPVQAKRYNSPGTFVPASQQSRAQAQSQSYPSQTQQVWPQPTPQIPQSPPSITQENLNPIPLIDIKTDLKLDSSYSNDDSTQKKWLKKGYKISMREKRRRQNMALRRLITPKNALMVLNELAAGSQQECTVIPDETFGNNSVNRQYVAILNIGGVEYSGKGSTKLMAKNMAAENIIRDMIIKQMNRLPIPVEPPSSSDEKMDEDKDEQSFPMIQLASYAIHKLFTEWQTDGYKVPLLNQGKCESPTPGSTTSTGALIAAPKPKKAPTIPANPETLHPCSLLSQMKGTLDYGLLAQEGTPPNGQIFTIGVTIDGKTYTGKATSKKDARKQAAKKACTELFGITYTDECQTMQTS